MIGENDPWAEFTPAPASPKADPWGEFKPAKATTPGRMTPTGEAHDGDTFRLSSGQNGRVYGYDAFELGQQARSPDGAVVPIGVQSRSALLPYLPGATADQRGAPSYGRPVVGLNQGGIDPVVPLLQQGMGMAAPEYLKDAPVLLRNYVEAERFARQNGQGAFGNTFASPKAARDGKGEPWAAPQAGKEGESEAVFWDEPLPFQGYRPEVERGYLDIAKDFSTTPDTMIAYVRENGMNVREDDIRKFYEDRARDVKVNAEQLEYRAMPRATTDLGDDRLGATVRGFADPINMVDEMGAVADTLTGVGGRESVWNSDRRFGDILANNLGQNRDILANDEADYPWWRFGGQMASGVVAPGASIEGVGLAAARSSLRGGASRFAARSAATRAVTTRLGTVGAIEGGLAGIGQGETLAERGGGALIGGTVGGVLGVGLGTGAPALGRLVGSRLRRGAGELDADPAAHQFVNGATDTLDADVQDAATSPRGRDYLGLDADPVRRPDYLGLGPAGTGIKPDPALPVNTAPPQRPLPPARPFDDVLPDIERWAAERGATRSADGTLPDVMLHGSPRPDITEFDPYGRGGYGLFGTGTYLTDTAQIGAQYSKKGLTRAAKEAAVDRTVYAVRQAVKTPLDMDAPADVAKWEATAKRVFGDYGDDGSPFFDLPDGATNEQFWREAEDYLTSEMVSASDGSETIDSLIRALGHDGITHVGGGRVGNGPRHRVVIALDPEQTEIVDRLSVGSLMQPPGPRAPDWIDVGQVSGGSRAVEPVAPIGRYQPSAAMANEVERPSLMGPASASGERTVDRIDVQQPRPLADGPTDWQRFKAAEAINPRDVLPAPSNTVSGLDEAVGIDAGRVVPVRAPNEMDALASRTIRSPTNGGKTMQKRGPLDLVTWLRTQGGVRAQGGELSHAGIDNTPRAGMDFAGGEGRFGKLVNNDGMTYDEAGERAWEAGFFTERPTPAEFIDALTQTHNGNQRRFLPDDEAEVDDFLRARDERYAVEAAKIDGSPLSVDRGQAVDMADLDANSPPMSAYEEWGENAPNLAGNIRLDKLDSPQAIKRALVRVEQVSGGFDAARRGRIAHAETETLAAELNLTPKQLLSRRKGQAFNAEEALAARQILAKSGNEIVNLAKRIQQGDATEREMVLWRESLVRHAAIQEQVSGITAEAGRALSAMRMVADSRAVDGRVLESLLNASGGSDGVRRAADMIVESAGDPKRLNTIAKQLAKPGWKDKAVELWYNFLLSGPRTHAVNITSNLLTSMAQIPEHALAAGVGAVRKALPGQADTDQVLFSELGARSFGFLQGTREGLSQAVRTFRTGETKDLESKVEAQTQEAIGGPLGKYLRTPTRLLSAEDELFKAMARRMEIAGLAVRRAKVEGLEGAEARARVAELTANPTPEMLDAAAKYGRYLTFQTPLGAGGQSIINLTSRNKWLKAFVPFVRTPINLLKFATERSPAAPVLREWRDDMAAGGARRDLATARMMVGTGAIMTTLYASQQGMITGNGPADQKARRLLEADGWQPYSFRISDKYFSYQRLDPFSTTLGIAADYRDLQEYMTDKEREETVNLLVASAVQNLANKTWLSGMSNVAEALADPERYGGNLISGTVGSFAVPAVLAQTAQAVDPVSRDAQGILAKIRSRIPGASQSLPVRRDVLGQPVGAANGGGLAAFSPIYSRDRLNDPVPNALLDAGIGISKPSRAIDDPNSEGKRKVTLTPEQYDQYQRVSGEVARPQLERLVASPAWPQMSREKRDKRVLDIMKAARKEGRSGLFGVPSVKPKESVADPWAEFSGAR